MKLLFNVPIILVPPESMPLPKALLTPAFAGDLQVWRAGSPVYFKAVSGLLFETLWCRELLGLSGFARPCKVFQEMLPEGIEWTHLRAAVPYFETGPNTELIVALERAGATVHGVEAPEHLLAMQLFLAASYETDEEMLNGSKYMRRLAHHRDVHSASVIDRLLRDNEIGILLQSFGHYAVSHLSTVDKVETFSYRGVPAKSAGVSC